MNQIQIQQQNNIILFTNYIINNSFNEINTNNIKPLNIFIEEVLKKAKISYNTLQLTLIYILRFIKETNNNNTKNIELKCGRRVFISALILATKYLLDRAYSNKIWSEIIELPNKDVNKIELLFAKSIKYNFYVSKEYFDNFSLYHNNYVIIK
jgi:PHO85 cyclin-5